MLVIKEFTYPYLFDDASDANFRPGKPLAAFGQRPANAEIRFPDASIHAECEEFANELKAGKEFTIHCSVLDPLFNMELLEPYHGLNIKTKLSKEADHANYIEDYTKLPAVNTPQPEYRFTLVTTGGKMIQCFYDTVSLTTGAQARFAEQFEGNKTVEISKFMVLKMDHRTIEKDSNEYLDFKLPNTANVPQFVCASMYDKRDFIHSGFRNNYFSDVFLNFVEKVKFVSATDLNPTYSEGVSHLDLNEKIDQLGAYKSQRRFMLGRENVNMSDALPAFGVLNGASREIYRNEGESKKSFMKMETGRHLSPYVFEMEPSHGKYGPDQKPTNMANTEISMNFTFRQALPETCVITLTSGYLGKYVMKKQSNGALDITYQNVDIAANQL